MTPTRVALPKAFKRAVVVSALLHVGLFVLIVVSPSFSRAPQKGLVQYVNFMGGTGGAPGSGGGGTVVAKTESLPPPKKPALRDLTVASKLKPEAKTSMTHPVDKPKASKKTPEKRAAISKPEPAASSAAAAVNAAAAAAQSGSGFGLRIGTGGSGSGGGTGGGGTGSGGGGDPFGVANFPFQFYLQMISDKITANWFQSLVDPGVGGTLQTEVYFRIYKNGQISDVRVSTSSGVESFDLSARRAIEASKPFAPLPNEYDGQYLGITLVFEHA
ncbi:MAG: energy transducer TonB, partial [Candidatus Aminicenantales bacterium]